MEIPMKRDLAICTIILSVASTAGSQAMAQGLDAAAYRQVLEAGLTRQMDFHRVPQGQIKIMSGLESQMEPGNAATMTFATQYLPTLQRAANDGLVRLAELQQNSLAQMGNMGARFFTVTPTDKLRQMSDPKESTAQWVAVPIGTIRILDIISADACKLKTATPGDQFRLIVGLISDTPTEQAKTLGPQYATQEPQKFKMRVILQFNPFTKTYTYVTGDYGKPEDADWITQNVAQIIAP